jgi:fumarylacetoacetate (FAA) hydrolase family protein
MRLDHTAVLPEDWPRGSYAARIMSKAGPVVLGIADGEPFDLTPAFGTVSRWLEEEDAAGAIRAHGEPIALDLAALVANSAHDARRAGRPWLLAPVDLAAVKGAGVTYVRSMLERVIEERCRGDALRAEAVRAEVRAIIGEEIADLRPGSLEAEQVKHVLLARGWWSQYLEVGIGPDAEIFTKCPPMAAVGLGAKVGVHPMSSWNNPEPEAVVVVNARGRIVGATLGNDVNLRDVEGRSALLLCRAKDNNASCALGPMIRLFDESFTLEDLRRATLSLVIEGRDGFRLEECGAIGAISRDPVELVGQLIGPHHQYPDGVVLFLGTPFSPVKDRGAPGMGFTHREGDLVTIRTPLLGALVNEVDRTDECPPWTFGAGALFASLARRGLPRSVGR